MDLKELVTKNRSYRGFDESRVVTREELLDLVELARLSASSVNMQPLKYRLAWEKEEVARIQKETRWARALADLNLPFEGTRPTAFIIICQDTRISDNFNQFQKDVGISAQSILLGAVEKGLGGCMIGNFTANGIRAAAGLPEHLAPLLVVAIGKPAETIVLTDVLEDGNCRYYRDEKNVHYVPKRRLEDIII